MTRDGTLDDLYLEWLYGQITSWPRGRTYWTLLKQMYSTRFRSRVAEDENRAEDGKDLRAEFEQDLDVEADELWLSLDCSFLELLVALARRMAYIGGGSPIFWFWVMVGNLDLHHYHDSYRKSPYPKQKVTLAMLDVINRRYSAEGVGGLFPLERAETDQRTTELWDQMAAYLNQFQYEPLTDRRYSGLLHSR